MCLSDSNTMKYSYSSNFRGKCDIALQKAWNWLTSSSLFVAYSRWADHKNTFTALLNCFWQKCTKNAHRFMWILQPQSLHVDSHLLKSYTLPHQPPCCCSITMLPPTGRTWAEMVSKCSEILWQWRNS